MRRISNRMMCMCCASIPCLVVFKGGEEVNRSVGLIAKDAIAELVEG